jgi:hypothetical protein
MMESRHKHREGSLWKCGYDVLTSIRLATSAYGARMYLHVQCFDAAKGVFTDACLHHAGLVGIDIEIPHDADWLSARNPGW